MGKAVVKIVVAIIPRIIIVHDPPQNKKNDSNNQKLNDS